MTILKANKKKMIQKRSVTLIMHKEGPEMIFSHKLKISYNNRELKYKKVNKVTKVIKRNHVFSILSKEKDVQTWIILFCLRRRHRACISPIHLLNRKTGIS